MEIWKDVKDFENCYQISNKGRLRSKDRFVSHYKGGVSLIKGVNKKIRLNRYGYLRCGLKREGSVKEFTIHRLVAIMFIDNPENKPQVNHINGIKTDNRVENLEWCTSEENTTHAVKSGLIKTRLTEYQVKEIMKSEVPNRKLGVIYGVSACIIWRIKNKKAYKHITNE